jgi:hypothetical protein
VALVITDVSEKHVTSIIGGKGIGEVGTTIAVTIKRRTVRRNTSFCDLIHEIIIYTKSVSGTGDRGKLMEACVKDSILVGGAVIRLQN